MNRATDVRTVRVLVNLYEGKMLTEFEAESRESAVHWLEREAIHFDWLMRVELVSDQGGLKPTDA